MAEMRWLDSITDSMDMNLIKLRDSGGHGAWNAAVCEVAESDTTHLLNNNIVDLQSCVRPRF